MAYGKLDFAVSLSPLTAFPLDKRSYFASLEEAEVAAASAKEVGSTETIYYIGQTLCVVENEHADFYIIQAGPRLEKISGSEVLIDESQFEYVDGKLSIKGFADAVAGAIPTVRDVGGKKEITWVLPSGDTAEGLAARLEVLEQTVQELGETVGNSQDRTGLFGELDKKANAEDVYDKDTTDQKIQEALKNSNHLTKAIVENFEAIDTTKENTLFFVPNDNKTKYYEYFIYEGEAHLVGDKSVFESVNPEQFTITQGQLNLQPIPDSLIPDLSSKYVTKVQFDTTVGDLNQLINIDNSTNIVEALVNLDARLAWKDIAPDA